MKTFFKNKSLFLFLMLVVLAFASGVLGQEEAEGSGEAAAEEAPAEEAPAAEGEAEGAGEVVEAEEGGAEQPAAEGEAKADAAGAEECEETPADEGGSGDKDSIEGILALGGDGGKKCKAKAAAAEGSDAAATGADALAAALGAETCDMTGMDDKLAGCLEGLGKRVETLEQAVLSGEGGSLEDQITLVLVKKGVIDCENDTQCDDDRACLDSLKVAGRKLCELPCERTRCDVPHAECKATNHEVACLCKEGFHGNGTESCVPDGFTEEENGKHYRIFDEEYVEFDEAVTKCSDLGARLPVLDSAETIEIIKKYLETGNFSVFEQWDRSSRRVWVGLIYERRTGLLWSDGQSVISYPASSRLFVWEARRLLSVEASKADASRHYGFYIDGDIAKLPGGGRKGAAVLCELLPQESGAGTPGNDPNRNPSYGGANYPNYPSQRSNY